VIELLVLCAAKGHAPKAGVVAECLTTAIERHAVAGHSAEMAWCLWAALVLDLKLPIGTEIMKYVVKGADNVTALLALDADSRGLLGLPAGAWDTFMTAEELAGSSWLLAYEANLKGWGAAGSSVDYVSSHPWFGQLKRAGVTFYDLKASAAGASPVVVAAQPLPGGAMFGFYV
jgi:hypothetical protein